MALAMASSPLPNSMGLSSSPTTLHHTSIIRVPPSPQLAARSPPPSSPSLPSGTCRASQAVELFPALHPKVVVRDAQLGDYWEVADTHCSSFFPKYIFPLDVLLKVNRFVGLLNGSSAPPGCMRTCLVAVTGGVLDENVYFKTETPNSETFEGIFGFNRESVAGILTLDNVGDFLPRRGPLRQRRTAIAYISNVAVREEQRRKGIAKMLVSTAVARAGSWGCRAIALHCDANDIAASNLYEGLGFRSIKVPEGANWPEPRSYPDTRFRFMMKLCSSV